MSVAVQVDGASVAGAVADVSTARCTPRRGATAHTFGEARARRRCGAVGSLICRCHWWAPDSATTAQTRQRQALVLADADAAGPRRSTVSVRRRWISAWSAAGRLDAYYEDGLQRVGLGGGRADRRRGGRRRAAAACRRQRRGSSSRRRRRSSRLSATRCADRAIVWIAKRSAATDSISRRPLWILEINVGSAGCGGLRPQAGQHGVDVVAAAQLGEVGADRQVDRVVGALVLIQLHARGDQPDRGRGRAPGRGRTGSGPGTPAGCSRRAGRSPRSDRRIRDRAARPATSAAWPPCPLALSTRILVSASLAGATSVMWLRVTCSPSVGWVGSLAAASAGGLHAAASLTSAAGSGRLPR